MKKKIKIILVILCVPFFISAVKSGVAFIDKYRSMISKEQTNLEFYGTVIDLEGNPINDAEIKMHIDTFNPLLPHQYFVEIKPTSAKTNDKGNFDYKGFGLDADVTTIIKEGYEALMFESKQEFQKKHKVEPTDFKSSPTNRIVYKIRKKNPVQFILKFSVGIAFEVTENNIQHEADLIKYFNQRYQYFDSVKPRYGDIYKDKLVIRLQFEKKGLHDNTIKLAIDEGTFILSDQRFYNAPKEGFQKEKILTLGHDKAYSQYFCIKCNDGKYYFFGTCNLYSDKESINKQFPENSEPADFRLIIRELYFAPESNGIFEYDEAYTRNELKKLKGTK